jgi:hypothetical protein
MNLREEEEISAEFNMSSMMMSYYSYADINHGDYQCLRLGAAKAKEDRNNKYRSQHK